MGRSPEIWAYKLLRTKYFHGVSSGNQHPYLLKSRYGKVSLAADFWARFDQPLPFVVLKITGRPHGRALPRQKSKAKIAPRGIGHGEVGVQIMQAAFHVIEAPTMPPALVAWRSLHGVFRSSPRIGSAPHIWRDGRKTPYSTLPVRFGRMPLLRAPRLCWTTPSGALTHWREGMSTKR